MKKIPYIYVYILLQAKLLFRSFKHEMRKGFFLKRHIFKYIYSFSVLHAASLGDALHNAVC
jgi:hypothetical protein